MNSVHNPFSRSTVHRREFIRWSSLAAASTLLPSGAHAFTPFRPQRDDVLSTIDPSDWHAVAVASRELATRAVDAARSAGAQYADVRLTHDITYMAGSRIDGFDHVAGVGVRALVDGCWGFASSPDWTPNEVVRLAQEAVGQARANRWGVSGSVQFLDTIAPAQGEWVMPVQQDPIDLPINEQADWIAAFIMAAEDLPRHGKPQVSLYFRVRRQQKTFASTEGALYTQIGYAMFEQPSLLRLTIAHPSTGEQVAQTSSLMTPMGAGWEAVRDIDAESVLHQLYERAWLQMESIPMSIGRFDIVFDASTAASIVHESLGVPLQIDRALGYEANAAGTSYLNFLEQPVGASFASPSLTVVGHRNQPGGVATVKWDDEGVEPTEITLVREGIVTDYATSREHVTALRESYTKHGIPLRSNGCAGAQDALGFPLVQSPNLEVVPTKQATTFDDLVAGTESGFAVYGGTAMMDQQQLTGIVTPAFVREIRKGKLGNAVRGLSVLYRSPELWKAVARIGGEGTQAWRGFQMEKGQPSQTLASSVRAVPMQVRNLAAIDVSRKLIHS